MAPVSARRATIQEKKARQQFLFSLIGTIVIGVIFVAFLMPLLFSFVVSLARKGKPIVEQGDVVPPQRPVLQPVKEFQNQTRLELAGYTEARAQVQLYVDSAQMEMTAANDDGAFSFSLELTEGEHEVWVSASDESGNISAESEHYRVVVDMTVPTLEISQPQDGAVFTLPRERTQSVEGKVSEKAQVRVNGALTQTSSDGNFAVTIQLAEGKNEIVVVATDEAGNASEEKKVTVEYRP